MALNYGDIVSSFTLQIKLIEQELEKRTRASSFSSATSAAPSHSQHALPVAAPASGGASSASSVSASTPISTSRQPTLNGFLIKRIGPGGELKPLEGPATVPFGGLPMCTYCSRTFITAEGRNEHMRHAVCKEHKDELTRRMTLTAPPSRSTSSAAISGGGVSRVNDDASAAAAADNNDNDGEDGYGMERDEQPKKRGRRG